MKNLYEKYKNSYKNYECGTKDKKNRWIVSYADFATVLLAVFIVLFAFQNIENTKNAFKTQKENVVQTAKIPEIPVSLKGKAEIIPEGSKLTVRLSQSVLFDEGSAIIKPESKETLKILAQELPKSAKEIRVEGHSDNVPIKSSKYGSNWELSAARSSSIADYLINNCGIDKTRLSAAGYADNKPIATNQTEKGRAKNRRVDIVIIN